MKKTILVILFLLAFATVSYGQQTYTCGTNGVDDSCTPSGMQTLVDGASDGDTINIATGTHDWSGTTFGVKIDKRITISGGGYCGTSLGDDSGVDCGDVAEPSGSWPVKLTNTSSNRSQMFYIHVTTPGTDIVRITGIHFHGWSLQYYQWWGNNSIDLPFIREMADSVSSQTRNIAQYRIDNNQFENESEGAPFDGLDIVVMSTTKGLIDHNYFNHAHWDGHMVMVYAISTDEVEQNIYGEPFPQPMGGDSFTEPLAFGGSNFVFIEDNSVIYRCPDPPPLGQIFGTNFIDGFNGSRVVARYNYITNAMVGLHDLSGGTSSRGAYATEIYENTFIWNACGATTHFPSPIGARAGAILCYDNYIDNWQRAFSFMYTRGSWPACDNSTGYDGDGDGSPDPDGWRCLDQAGTGQTSGPTTATVQPQAAEPVRFWGNTFVNGSPSCSGTLQKGNWVCNSNTTYIIEDVNYLFSPVTGNTQDDTYELGGYTSYTYPHPLQGGGDATPPVISNPSPSGSQACSANPRSITIEIDTDESATCKYDTSDVLYDSMSNTFSTTGGTTHGNNLNLNCDSSYTYYTRCEDGYGNQNSSSTTISFSINDPGPTVSNPLPSGAHGCGPDPLAVTLQVTTDENATCKFDSTDEEYDLMTYTFATTGATLHQDPEDMACNGNYTWYVRCMDSEDNKNGWSTEITFSVAAFPTFESGTGGSGMSTE